MTRFCITFLILFFGITSIFSGLGVAQQAVETPLEIGASGEAYLRSIRLRRIETDTRYFDPTRPAPELTTQAKPPPPDKETSVEPTPTESRAAVIIISAILLIGIAFLFARFGGRFSVSLGREGDNATRQMNVDIGDRPDWAKTTQSLSQIIGQKDRRLALIALAQRVLADTVKAQGLLMQRSWTARDALARLPEETSHLPQLRDLILASERVHFGNRDILEDDFKAIVTTIRPLISEVPR